MALIAITTCRKLHDYEESIRRAGGEPRVIDLSAGSPEDVIRSVSGLLLTGGGDVQPDLYGAVPHHTYSAAEPGRDAYEIELVRRAFEQDVPVLAICRGMQVLNVARGGTLVQDIPSQVASALEHKLEVPPHQPVTLAHEVWIEKDSTLGQLVADAECQVNSRHHQAVDRLGNDLVTVATAPDGVIEAIEAPARRFCLGVEWHPENFYRTGEFRELFERFVRACETR